MSLINLTQFMLFTRRLTPRVIKLKLKPVTIVVNKPKNKKQKITRKPI